MSDTRSYEENTIAAAIEAFDRGYCPVPIFDKSKKPFGAGWQHARYGDRDDVIGHFVDARRNAACGVGLILGEGSRGLVDVDMDHPLALRLRMNLLPPTAMRTGRAGRPSSHYWYTIDGELPSTRQYKMPGGAMCIELRCTGGQTVIPPTVHPCGESYEWFGEPWGGEAGPLVHDGRKLLGQVALLALSAVLLENWPKQGGRHEAYLALAGGLLRYGDRVHPLWQRYLPVVIDALADASHDDVSGSTRVAEVMASTIERLNADDPATGFPKLAEIIGTDHVKRIRMISRDLESLNGWTNEPVRRLSAEQARKVEVAGEPDPTDPTSDLERNPMDERVSSWGSVDLEPYLSGRVVMPRPGVLFRSDGEGLMYPGRVNSIFGLSESAKSWIALWATTQEIANGGRVIYIDFEDSPEGTVSRLRAIGVGDEDIVRQFRYVNPSGPLADMERYRFGRSESTEGVANAGAFDALLEVFDPTLIIADGMTVLYGLHGHDTNEATATEVITSWLKMKLTRGGRTTVVVIDHTGKSAGPGSSPIGSHHKVAMVQGTALRVDVLDRPMPGAVGRVQLAVFKDRPGSVRKISASIGDEQVAGIVTIDSSQGRITRIAIDALGPDEVSMLLSPKQAAQVVKQVKITSMGDKVLEMFGDEPGRRLATSDVASLYPEWEHEEIRDACAALVKRGALRKIQLSASNNSVRYVLPESDDE